MLNKLLVHCHLVNGEHLFTRYCWKPKKCSIQKVNLQCIFNSLICLHECQPFYINIISGYHLWYEFRELRRRLVWCFCFSRKEWWNLHLALQEQTHFCTTNHPNIRKHLECRKLLDKILETEHRIWNSCVVCSRLSPLRLLHSAMISAYCSIYETEMKYLIKPTQQSWFYSEWTYKE